MLNKLDQVLILTIGIATAIFEPPFLLHLFPRYVFNFHMCFPKVHDLLLNNHLLLLHIILPSHLTNIQSIINTIVNQYLDILTIPVQTSARTILQHTIIISGPFFLHLYFL